MEWSQLGQKPKNMPAVPDAGTSVSGLLKINRHISLKYDPDRWKPAAPDNDGPVALTHSAGSAHVMIIAEPLGVPRGSLEDLVLANAQFVDPNARIVYRAQRRINGVDVRFLKIEADVNEVPMVYWGFFYGGEYGTVQVVTCTAQTRLPEYEKDFTDLLNGFAVAK